MWEVEAVPFMEVDGFGRDIRVTYELKRNK